MIQTHVCRAQRGRLLSSSPSWGSQEKGSQHLLYSQHPWGTAEAGGDLPLTFPCCPSAGPVQCWFQSQPCHVGWLQATLHTAFHGDKVQGTAVCLRAGREGGLLSPVLAAQLTSPVTNHLVNCAPCPNPSTTLPGRKKNQQAPTHNPPLGRPNRRLSLSETITNNLFHKYKITLTGVGGMCVQICTMSCLLKRNSRAPPGVALKVKQ